jgi:hypothetical protein
VREEEKLLPKRSCAGVSVTIHVTKPGTKHEISITRNVRDAKLAVRM